MIRLMAPIFIVTISTTAYPQDLGTVGMTYPIRERDALDEIQSRAATINWKKETARIKPAHYRPENSVSLPRAVKNRAFLVDMTYTLDMDIPDGKGGILYPKGYSFNPLDYVPLRKQLVIINGSDQDQLAWFRQSPFAGRPDVMLLLTEGAYLKLGETLGRPLFYADSRITEKFRLQAVPSIVRQEGKIMRVEEIDVRPAKLR